MEKMPYTRVKIETFDGEETRSATIETTEAQMVVDDLVQLVKQAILGMAYHWDSVQDAFNESEETQ